MRSYFAAATEVLDFANNTTVKVLTRALHVVRERKERLMKKHSCPYCEYSCDQEKGLKVHIGRSHKDKKTPAAPSQASQEPAQAVSAPETQPGPAQEPLAAPGLSEAYTEGEPEFVGSIPPRQDLPVSPRQEVPKPTTITIGSAIMLKGPTWWQNPGTMEWTASIADRLVVVVVSKEVVGNDIMLLCRAEGGSALWAVQEKQVLEGNVKLVRLAPEVESTAQAVRPPDGPRKVEDPPFDYFEEERKKKEAEEQREAERQKYSTAIMDYTAARSAKKSAEVQFEEVKKTTYSVLWDYIKRWGKPSAEGKDDFQVVEFGWKGHITRSAQPVIVKRDRTKIVEWLEQNGHAQALVHDVNLPEWEKLKASGAVPAEFIRQVEVPEQDEDRFALRVDPA